ncbi:MAG: WD40 repeat domain-containing protein, partial [Pseudobdellovibrionaceae bacterium]
MAISSEISRLGRDSTLEYALSNLTLEEEVGVERKQKEEEGKREEAVQKDYSREGSIAYSDGPSGGVWRVMGLGPNKIVSASYDHLGKLLTTKQTAKGADFENIKLLAGHKREVLSLAKLTDQVFLTGSSDGSICIWNNDGDLVGGFKDRYVTGFYSMAVLDENTVATGSCHRPKKHHGNWDHVIKIWDISKKRFLFSLEGHAGGISGLVNLGNNFIASSSGDSTVRVWSTESRKALSIFEGHTDYIYGLATFDESHVVTASKDRTVRIIDVSTNQQVGALKHEEGLAHASTVYDVNTLGNSVVVTGSRDGYVKIWDQRTFGCIKILDVDDGFVYAANFTPDGKIIAGTSGKHVKIQKAKKESKESKQKEPQNNAHVVLWDFRS